VWASLTTSIAPYPRRRPLAGKHIVLEKPMCLNLAEANRMLAALPSGEGQVDVCRGIMLRAEYVGSSNFWTAARWAGRCSSNNPRSTMVPTRLISGCGPRRSGVTMDMGCHAIGVLPLDAGPAAGQTVYAQMGTHVHQAKDPRGYQSPS